MFFGWYFFIFGIIILIAMLKQKDKSWYMGLLFIFIGAGAMFVSFYEKYPNILNINLTPNQIATFLIFILLVVVGIAFAIVPTLRIIIKRKVCTHRITAKIVGIKSTRYKKRYGTGKAYRPVYQYTYKNKKYNKEYNFSANFGIKGIGEKDDIFINPNNPSDALIINIPHTIFLAFIGLSCFVPIIIYFLCIY